MHEVEWISRGSVLFWPSVASSGARRGGSAGRSSRHKSGSRLEALIELRCALTAETPRCIDLPVSAVAAALMALRARSRTKVTIKVKMIVSRRGRLH